ncbi:MmgE/PrpD family protein [Pseudonocardia sp. RS010]|uniref:MmgE/PrpD family protein n=1 Tax=Pseudonocardia sp. RS010 TaxID=3385979 RepID=UPI00399EEA32
MDVKLETIVEFVHVARQQPLRENVAAAAVRHFVDGLGCAAGGLRSTGPAKLTAAFGGLQSERSASGCGMDEKVSVYAAAIINSSMARALDYNDTYIRVPSGHPNDMTPALFALAESIGASGEEFLRASWISYEIFAALSDVAPIRDRGWDQGIQCSTGVAAAGSYLLDLSPEQTANAISLALTPALPMRVVRTGELSEWKGCATAHAGMTALMAVDMARAGLTGPPMPFDGVDGLCALATGPFKLEVPSHSTRSAFDDTLVKHFPAELSSQVPIEIALALRDEGLDPASVTSIEIDIHRLGWTEIGGGQGDVDEKWHPTTRETADHSLPYIFAAALVDAAITPHTFAEQRLSDPRLADLIAVTHVREDPELTERLASDQALATRITVRTGAGEEIVREQDHPLGAPARQMTRADIEEKARPMLSQVLGRPGVDELLSAAWDLPAAARLDDVAGLMRALT